MVAATRAAEILEALSGFLWPVLVAVVLWRLFPTIKAVLRTRDYTIDIAGNTISVQNASEQLHAAIADLRRQVEALAEASDAEPAEAVAPAETEEAAPALLPHDLRILWVDDVPENNAFLIQSFRDEGAEVVEATSTAQALGELTGRAAFDVVITDMGRNEERGYRAHAAVDLIRAMRESGIRTPVVVYASPQAIARGGAQALEAGAAEVTSSPTQLLRTVRVAPTTAFERAVADLLRQQVAAKPFPVRRTFDFLVERDGRRVGVEIKNWGSVPTRAKIVQAFDELERARSTYELDEIFMVVPELPPIPSDLEPPAGVSLVTPEELVERFRARS